MTHIINNSSFNKSLHSLSSQSKTKTLLLFGTNQTGKTSLLLQLTKNRFEQEYQPTIGVNFYFKELSSVTLSIWDTCGSELNDNFLPKHLFSSANCYIILLSYADIESLNESISYINYIKSQTISNYMCSSLDNNKPIIALINKNDIKDKQFRREEAIVALRNACPNILIGEISAKNSYMVKRFFEKVESLLMIGTLQGVKDEENDENNLLMFASTFKINDDRISKASRRSVYNKTKKKKCCG